MLSATVCPRRTRLHQTTQFVYDELGRLKKVKDALNQETIYTYSEIGQQLTQTDANNHTTRFEYDQLGRVATASGSDTTSRTLNSTFCAKLRAIADAITRTN